MCSINHNRSIYSAWILNYILVVFSGYLLKHMSPAVYPLIQPSVCQYVRPFIRLTQNIYGFIERLHDNFDTFVI